MNSTEKKKLETYVGFLKKSKSVVVGRNLEMKLKGKEVRYLVLFPSCSERSKEDLLKLSEGDVEVKVLEYLGDFRFEGLLGLKELKAIGITNPNLGKAVYDLLVQDMETK